MEIPAQHWGKPVWVSITDFNMLAEYVYIQFLKKNQYITA